MNPKKTFFLTMLTTTAVLVLTGGGFGSANPPTQARKGDPGRTYTSWREFLDERRAILKSQDLHVYDTFLDSLDSKAEHGVVIWHEIDREINYTKGSVVEVYEIEPAPDQKSMINKVDEVVFEGVSASFDALNGRDLNGDGLRELLLLVGTEANCWGCWHIKLLQLREGQLKELPVELTGSVVTRRVEDVDGDGRFEVIGLDARWEWGFKGVELCHGCSPRVEVIYIWENGKYIEASRRFPKFYDKRIAGLEKELKSPFNDQSYIGDAASLLLNYIRKGEPEQGWKRFQELINPTRFKHPGWANSAQDAAKELKEAYGL